MLQVTLVESPVGVFNLLPWPKLLPAHLRGDDFIEHVIQFFHWHGRAVRGFAAPKFVEWLDAHRAGLTVRAVLGRQREIWPDAKSLGVGLTIAPVQLRGRRFQGSRR